MSFSLIMDAKKVHRNEKGQSLIEFMVFLPFLVMMYSVTVSLGNAINASINQQKATRAYSYYLLANNSMLPGPERDSSETSEPWSFFSTYVIGWNERLDGNNPVAPCFKFALPLGDGDETSCDDNYTTTTTQFIRVKTIYGICGATYLNKNGERISYPRSLSEGAVQHCINQN